MAIVAYWLYAVFSIYALCLLAVLASRVRSDSPAPRLAVVRNASSIEVRQGAQPGSIVGKFLIVAFVFWTTVASLLAYLAIDLMVHSVGGLMSFAGCLAVAMLVFALSLVLGSLWLAFGRWGVRIDGAERRVIAWWGLLRPWWQRSRPLNTYSSVAIYPLPRRLWQRRRTFGVRLEGNGAPLPIDKVLESELPRALDLAQQIGAVSKLPMKDFSNV